MRTTGWLALGFTGMIVVACGGGVSLGETDSQLKGEGTKGGSSGGGGGGGSGTGADCTKAGACGPALGMPSIVCPDGSIGGNTGKCLARPDGTCGWEIRECPKPPPPACFDASGNLDPSYKTCKTAADCVVVPFQVNCCGTMHAAGVSASSAEAVKKCAADRAAGFPACDCATAPTGADDGTIDPGGGTAQVTCNAKGLCESTFKGEVCGKEVCTKNQTCCSGMPLPEPKCIDGNMCPISQARHKKDIKYLSEDRKQTLADELLGFRLATYRYKSERDDERAHLGFIIDDVAPSPAVTSNGERVDMYGYQTMTVATLQVQAKEIAELRRQVEDLKKSCSKR
jgi:hypothetical protein